MGKGRHEAVKGVQAVEMEVSEARVEVVKAADGEKRLSRRTKLVIHISASLAAAILASVFATVGEPMLAHFALFSQAPTVLVVETIDRVSHLFE